MRLSHDQYYLAMLKLVAQRSTCVRRAVGAIIVDEKNRVLSTGYNGVPSGFQHCSAIHPCAGALDLSGDTRQCMAVHAEQNALLQCSRLDLAHTLFVSCSPCFTCAKLLANTSIRRVVCLEVYADPLGAFVLEQARVRIVIADSATPGL